MSAPSPRCGRLDGRPPHVWIRPSAPGRAEPIEARRHACFGHLTTEGAQPCVQCQRAVVACRCEQERARERDAEWWAEA